MTTAQRVTAALATVGAAALAVSFVAPAAAIAPSASQVDSAISAKVRADIASVPGTVTIRVIDSDGTYIVGAGADRPMLPASTMKVITAINAVTALGPDHRFTTEVVAGGSRRSIVLVGGGDPLLDTSTLRRLASRTADGLQSRGVRDVVVRLDDDLYPSPTDADGWLSADVPAYASPVRPLGMLGDYSVDTAVNATSVFMSQLEAFGISARYGGRTSSSQSARVVASVRPHTVAQAVRTMLVYSENNVAEQLFRQVAIATGFAPTWEGAISAAEQRLTALRIPVRGVRLHDGSGLSMDDRLTARTLTVALRKVVDGSRPDLVVLRTSLPTAGRTGTLASRFWSSSSSCAVGHVFAKTGSLSGVQTLAGLTRGADGHWKIFAIMVNDLRGDARPVIDEMAAEINGCR